MPGRRAIVLHEEALRRTHPVFCIAPHDCDVFFLWEHERLSDWSFKKCLFVVEALSEMRVDLIVGDMAQVSEAYDEIYLPQARDPRIRNAWKSISCRHQIIDDEPYFPVVLRGEPRRFFAYWKQAETQWRQLLRL